MMSICDVHAIDFGKNPKVSVHFLDGPERVRDPIPGSEVHRGSIVHVSDQLANKFRLTEDGEEHGFAMRANLHHVLHAIELLVGTGQLMASDVASSVIVDIDAADEPCLTAPLARLSIDIHAGGGLSFHHSSVEQSTQVFLRALIDF